MIVGSISTRGYARDVAVSGCYAYIADAWSGLYVIDISTPASPVMVGSVEMESANGVVVVGGYVYVAAGSSGLVIANRQCP